MSKVVIFLQFQMPENVLVYPDFWFIIGLDIEFWVGKHFFPNFWVVVIVLHLPVLLRFSVICVFLSLFLQEISEFCVLVFLTLKRVYLVMCVFWFIVLKHSGPFQRKVALCLDPEKKNFFFRFLLGFLPLLFWKSYWPYCTKLSHIPFYCSFFFFWVLL